VVAIARFFLENTKFTLVVTLGLFLFGLMGLFSVSRESFPSVDIGAVNITTIYPGASAEDIESKITRPIEKEIRSVRGLKEVKSVSQPGISTINVMADIDNYQVSKVVSDLQRAVDRTSDLPIDLENPPRFFEVKSEEFPLIELAVVGPNDQRTRDRIADELKEALEDNKSVATITLTGFRHRQFNIILDPAKLKKRHVGVNEVVDSLRRQNVNIPGGDLQKETEQRIVRIEGKRQDVKSLEELVVRANFSGEKVLLKDVAIIEDGEEEPQTLAMLGGRPATLITIAKKGGADIIALSEQVKKLIDQFETKYGETHQFIVYNDEGIRVGNRVGVLSSNGLVGLILVVLFLFIFLPGPVGIMAAFSLPLTIFVSLGFIYSYGLTLNTITILAMVIALGMLVDNAVVVSENFVRLKEEGLKAQEALLETIRTLWAPIAATAMTTIAAFAPMLVTKGIIGGFISGIPIVVIAALMVSLFEGYLLLPTRLYLIDPWSKVRLKSDNNKDWFDRFAIPPFRRLVTTLVRHPYFSALLFSGLIALALFMMIVANRFVLFPADQTEIYVARIELSNNALINQTQERLQFLSQKVHELIGEDVAYVVGKSGISEQDFGDPKSRRGDNVGMLFIFMTEDAKNNQITADVLKKMRTIQIDGTTDLSFEALINGPPVGDPVTLIFRSNNEEQVYAITDKMMDFLKNKNGIFDVRLDDVSGPNEVYVEIDPVRASRLGLSHLGAGQILRAAIAGEILGDVTLENKDVNYFVRYLAKNRASIEDLKNIQVSDQSGNLIPISQIADIREQPGSPHIKRFDFKRAKTVTANLDDLIITSVEANSQALTYFKQISAQFPDVKMEFGGEAERSNESMESLFQALILSIVGIFALLVLLFKSYVRPLIILTTIPLGLIGVAFAFYFHGRPISFLAVTGVIGLGGIIVNSGIILISFIDQLRTERPAHTPIQEILVDAAALRLRAVIVTSLTTVCGLLPTAYGIGGSDEFIIPMTLALGWGLVSGTILTILWVPSAYAITEDISRRFGLLRDSIRGSQS
jgi:multidrug efflux pump subunit AcrB